MSHYDGIKLSTLKGRFFSSGGNTATYTQTVSGVYTLDELHNHLEATALTEKNTSIVDTLLAGTRVDASEQYALTVNWTITVNR